MSTITNPAELRRRGVEALVRELGYVDAMRFLHQYDPGQGDYTRERHELLPAWTPEEIVQEADRLAPRSAES